MCREHIFLDALIDVLAGGRPWRTRCVLLFHPPHHYRNIPYVYRGIVTRVLRSKPTRISRHTQTLKSHHGHPHHIFLTGLFAEQKTEMNTHSPPTLVLGLAREGSQKSEAQPVS